MSIPGPDMDQCILLITDGEVWQSEKIISKVRSLNHRVFTVGVGSAVAEGFVRQLAMQTGGACELVVPNENMTEKIVRHFKRMYLPWARNVRVHWPVEPVRVVPDACGPVYDGDTLHMFGIFDREIQGPVTLEMMIGEGQNISQQINVAGYSGALTTEDGAGPFARMAAQQRLPAILPEEAVSLAVRYQLVSPLTNYLVVDVRPEGEQEKTLPLLRKVPQMLAAGWGGSGNVINDLRMECNSPARLYSPQRKESRASFFMDFDESLEPSPSTASPLVNFIQTCNRQLDLALIEGEFTFDFAELIGLGLPEEIFEKISLLADQCGVKLSDRLLLTAFFHVISLSTLGESMSRPLKRTIAKAYKMKSPPEALVEQLESFLNSITESD
jgi:Ca-activated chloride channel family protein